MTNKTQTSQRLPPLDYERRLVRRLHRVTGLGMVLFLGLHIGHIGLMALGPAIFDSVTALLNQPPVRLLHIFLFFSVLFHAANGLRTIILELIPSLERYQRHSIYLMALLVALVFIPSSLLILMDAFLPEL